MAAAGTHLFCGIGIGCIRILWQTCESPTLSGCVSALNSAAKVVMGSP